MIPGGERTTPTVLPDYRGLGIVNLMASVVAARGGAPTGYPLLEAFDAAGLAESRNLVLLVIDGLGYRHLMRADVAPTLRHHLRARLTSVFPSTTAAAIPTFLSGLAPAQHGLTGWHMFFREIGTVAAVLPFHPRHCRRSLRESRISPETLLQFAPVCDRLPEPSWVIAPERFVHSDFNAAASGRAHRVGYRSLEELSERMLDTVRADGRKYVYAYYPELDSIAHVHGIGSAEARIELARVDTAIDSLLRAMQGTDTTLLVTADHGFVDTTAQTRVDMKDHPDLAETLVLPLCGEPRVAYCYVDPDRVAAFENYVADHLAQGFTLSRSRDLIARGWYGPGKVHPRLADRVGHYTLLARDNWTIGDQLLGESKHVQVGTHGGVTGDEMHVPLIVARV
jgi:hypothetical protein